MDASAGYCPSAPNNHLDDGCPSKSVIHVFMVISMVPNKRMVKVATFNKFAGEKLCTRKAFDRLTKTCSRLGAGAF